TIAPVSSSLSRLRSIARLASRSDSTKTARAAPRESASSPIAPEPAKRSSTEAPSTGPIRLKAASRTRSPVGRVSTPLGAKMRAPLRDPATIRIRDQIGQRAVVAGQRLRLAAGALEQRPVAGQAREAQGIGP